ncbi:MAG: TAT-variant-translocated molybdopterin oxidoreductase, partial [Limisphaerales bacterium]
MNPNSTTPASPATPGRRYWRSLDELSDTPEFKEWLHREFPQGASEFSDPVSRRHFVKIMSASFALAGLGLVASGCRRPEEELVPFSKAPEDGYNYGTPEYFATAMPTRTGAVPLVVKSYDGRPIKIEGNALYPDGNGGTDRYVQASILDLYDPDRARCFKRDGKEISREEALKFLDGLSQKFAANQGKGLCFLMERNTSPSFKRLKGLIQRKFPQAGWWVHEPVDFSIHKLAATLAFDEEATFVHDSWGHTRAAYPRLDKATRILSLDCDFLGGEEDGHRFIRDFAKSRKPEAGGGMSRLYAIESLFTLTGTNADHRLRVPASAIPGIAARIAVEVLNLAAVADAEAASLQAALKKIPETAQVDPQWIKVCAQDLIENRGRALVLAGQRQPLAVHLIAHAMNAALGAVGKTVEIQQTLKAGQQLEDHAIALWSLAKYLSDSSADTLVILGSNPVYSSPANLDWVNMQRKVKTVVRLGFQEDETGAICNWHFPKAHYLESWGDAATTDGTLVPIQPLIQPLFGGLTELEFLARIAGETPANPYDIVRATFAGSDDAW